MLLHEVGECLRELSELKQDIKGIRQELREYAVNELGMQQEVVSKLDIEQFMDGYLVGKGSIQNWRLAET